MIENYDTLETDVTKLRNPVQPLYKDEQGVVRFKPNSIVDYLFTNKLIDLNKIASMNFPQDDREQFWQMLGYSLSGYGNLSFVSDETYTLAATQVPTPDANARAEILRKDFKEFRAKAKAALEELNELIENDHSGD